MPLTLPCEAVPNHPDFVHLSTLRGIAIDLRYGSTNNFLGRDVYAPFDGAWLHRVAAEALMRARDWLLSNAPTFQLIVLDALRPQRAHEQLYSAVEGTPFNLYLANPVRGSIHSFGMAVDVSLLDSTGHEVDMGTGFDDFTERSHPAKEALFLADGTLTAAHVENRSRLRTAMQSGGFQGINTEWWHFDCGDRLVVRAEYARVL